MHAPEILDENRFLAARDGVGAELVDPLLGHAVAVRSQADELLGACAPHAEALGCAAQLHLLADLLVSPGPAYQRQVAERAGLEGLVSELSTDFSRPLSSLAREGA